MLILRGAPALSAFRHGKLLEQLTQKVGSVSGVYAEFAHFAEVTGVLTEDEQGVLARLLKYGPSVPVQEPSGRLFLVVPRFGTISPWSSKATDIAHNCGLAKIERLERGIAYYVSGEFDDVAAAIDGSDRRRRGRWGVYALGQQTVYTEAPDSKRGLTVFAGAVIGDAGTAPVRYFVEAGLVYQGTFAGRDDDTVNLAFAHGRINGRLVDAERTANTEAPGVRSSEEASLAAESPVAAVRRSASPLSKSCATTRASCR